MTQIVLECTEDQQFTAIVGSKPILKRHHLRMFQDEFSYMAKDKDLTLTDWRVYAAVLSHIEFENKFLVSQKALEEELAIDRGNISKSLKKLCDKKILVHTGNIGKQKIYHLDPDYGFKGRNTRLGSMIRAIKNGQAPTQKSFTMTEVWQEEHEAPNLVQILSKQADIPSETVERLLSALAAMQEPEE